jgi:hypothetical protein
LFSLFLPFFLSLFPDDVKKSLEDIDNLCKESFSYSLIFIEKGLFGTKEASSKTSIIRYLTSTTLDEELIKQSYNILETIISHGWQIGIKLIECDLFKKIFIWINEILKPIVSPSSYSPILSFLVEKISKIVKIEFYYLNCVRQFITEGCFLFFLNVLRIHSSYCFIKTSPYYNLSTEILNNLCLHILWNIGNSFILSEKGYETTFRLISDPVNGCDLLFRHYTMISETGSIVSNDVKEGIYCAGILSFLHAYTDLPPNYQSILVALKSEIGKSDINLIRLFLLSISLLETTSNRVMLYQQGFHSVIFDLLIIENLESLGRLNASQVLCNMTCEESASIKNNILNSNRFKLLKKLMDKIICSSPESTADKNVAERNALTIESILLILSNMLVGNKEALTSMTESGFIPIILEHLSTGPKSYCYYYNYCCYYYYYHLFLFKYYYY